MPQVQELKYKRKNGTFSSTKKRSSIYRHNFEKIETLFPGNSLAHGIKMKCHWTNTEKKSSGEICTSYEVYINDTYKLLNIYPYFSGWHFELSTA